MKKNQLLIFLVIYKILVSKSFFFQNMKQTHPIYISTTCLPSIVKKVKSLIGMHW